MRRMGWLGGAAALSLSVAGGAEAATEITMWHAMSGANTQRIEALVDGSRASALESLDDHVKHGLV